MSNQNTTREEMLKECIEYAVKNGFKSDKFDVQIVLQSIRIDSLPDMVEGYVTEDVGITMPNPEKSIVRIDPLYFVNVLLFDHDFCKAVYGLDDSEDHSEDGQGLWINSAVYDGYQLYDMAHFRGEAWQFHIQQMAVADDSLLYMYNYINNERS